MPLFRAMGYWAMERGVDGLTFLMLLSIVPVLPFILGVGMSYELFTRLDLWRKLSERTHWALATLATGLLVVIAGIVMLGGL